MNIVLLGKPGSGKGTIAKKLEKRFLDDKLRDHIATGDLVREEIARETESGILMKKYLDTGQLVPSELIIKLIIPAIVSAAINKDGFILDGSPRKPKEARDLLTLIDTAQGINLEPDYIFNLKISDETSKLRMMKRGRYGETSALIDKRLKEFHDNSQVYNILSERYQIIDINAEMPVDAILKEIRSHLPVRTKKYKATISMDYPSLTIRFEAPENASYDEIHEIVDKAFHNAASEVAKAVNENDNFDFEINDMFPDYEDYEIEEDT